MRDQDTTSPYVGAVGNAVTILRLLAHRPEPGGVAAIARESGISTSTCFNILRTLATEGLVSFDLKQKTYALGLGLLELSIPLLGVDQVDLIQPELRRLALEHNSLICLWRITDNERVVLVDRVSSTQTLRVDMSPGARVPAYIGAIGRCYAAHKDLPEAELKERFDSLKWQSPLTFAEYLDDVERAKKNAYAFDFGHIFAGFDTCGTLIVDSSGTARFGVSSAAIKGQIEGSPMETLAIDLRDTARRIGRSLFGTG